MKLNVISKKMICFLQLKSFGNFIFRFEYNEGHDIVFTEMKTFSIIKIKFKSNEFKI